MAYLGNYNTTHYNNYNTTTDDGDDDDDDDDGNIKKHSWILVPELCAILQHVEHINLSY
jgi:uncharacterized sporulation protein YeaH/YhbH (DUF444 family)